MSPTVDIKTVPAEGAAKDEFSKKLFDMGYFTQAAYYLDGWNDLEFEPYRPADWERKETFVFIVVEKAPPYAVAVYQTSPQAIEAGRRVNHERLGALMESQASGIWPGYLGTPQLIDIPPFAYRRRAMQDLAEA
jgi:PDDEXK-like domain of unknown function (DUF3799)